MRETKVKSKVKNQNAITLIALVITIIVMLILAGISISTLTGENGVLTKASQAKESTRAGRIKEAIELLVSENETANYIDGYAKWDKQSAIEKLKKDGILTGEEIAELQQNDRINIGGIEIDFGLLSNSGKKLKVEYTKSEGEDLWNSIVTFNISMELSLEEKKARAIKSLACSTYEEFKVEVAGSVEDYDDYVAEQGEEAFLDNEILEIVPFSLVEAKELVSYMFDYSNYEEFKTAVQEVFDNENTYEENMGFEDEIDEQMYLCRLIKSTHSIFSYKDIDKLERLGVDVITVKTPYNTTLYTTSLGGEVKCGFIKNGNYTFTIQSGKQKSEQTVEISNIRNYDNVGPHDVKVEITGDMASGQPVPTVYRKDGEETWNEASDSIINVNNSIEYKIEDTVYGINWISYVIKDEEYFKYFADEQDWNLWCDNRMGFWFDDEERTARQTILYILMSTNFNRAIEVIFDSEWLDYLNEIYRPQQSGEVIDEEKLLEKYPKSGIGVSRAANREESCTIDITKDTNIFIVSQSCLTTDMYVEVVVWDEEKKKWMRRRKKIKDVTYDDKLLVWDFDKGEFTIAKPLWIMKPKVATSYNLLKFSDGSILKTIDQHRIFNKEKGKFTYPMTEETPIGTTTYTADGKEVKLISKEKVVVKEVEYVNIITEYHMNLFANNILTSCRFSNLYPIKDMKYEKDERNIVSKEEYPNIPEEYYYGLRLGEQPIEVNRENDVKHANSIEEHIQKVYIDNAK